MLASIGTGVALLGGGVYATMTSSLTASASENVGSFGCMITNVTPDNGTHPGAVVDLSNNNGQNPSVTITNTPITKTDSSNALAAISLKNTGTIPAAVHWTLDYNTPGYRPWFALEWSTG